MNHLNSDRRSRRNRVLYPVTCTDAELRRAGLGLRAIALTLSEEGRNELFWRAINQMCRGEKRVVEMSMSRLAPEFRSVIQTALVADSAAGIPP